MKEIIQGIKVLVSLLFKDNYGRPITLTTSQALIVKKIVFLEESKICIAAWTGMGKTFVVAIAILLCAIKNKGIRIGIISASKKQSSLCYNYILGFISREHKFWDLVGTRSGSMKDLNSQLSRESLSVGDGKLKSVIGIFTANLKGNGSNLLGLHFDVVVEDESVLIPDEIEKTKILRMLERGPDDLYNKVHVKVSTTQDINHFKKWFDSETVFPVTVTVEDSFRDGRVTREFIEQQKEELGELFGIWYMCEFPELGSDKVFSLKDIKSLLVKSIVPKNLKGEDSVVSCDVARFGSNKTVITFLNKNAFGYFSKCVDFYRGKDTVYTFGRCKELALELGARKIIIDDCGVGGGVTDMLRKDQELKQAGVVIVAFNAAKHCKRKGDVLKYVNYGTKSYMFLKELIRKDVIVYLKNSFIQAELEGITKEFTSTGQLRVFKKGSHGSDESSPDFTDSVVIGLSNWWYGGAVIDVYAEPVLDERIEYL